MEKYLTQQYRAVTGEEPGRIVLLNKEPIPSSAKEFEFIDIKKVKGICKIRRITDLHRKSKKDYSGTSVLLGRFYSVHLDETLNGLNEGERITIPLYGNTLKEIAEKRKQVCGRFEGEHPTKRDFFKILDGLCITDGFLLKRPYEILSNDNSAAASFEVLNEHGWHARPAAVFCKYASKHDCDVYVKKGDNITSAKSIMGLMTL